MVVLLNIAQNLRFIDGRCGIDFGGLSCLYHRTGGGFIKIISAVIGHFDVLSGGLVVLLVVLLAGGAGWLLFFTAIASRCGRTG